MTSRREHRDLGHIKEVPMELREDISDVSKQKYVLNKS